MARSAALAGPQPMAGHADWFNHCHEGLVDEQHLQWQLGLRQRPEIVVAGGGLGEQLHQRTRRQQVAFLGSPPVDANLALGDQSPRLGA